MAGGNRAEIDPNLCKGCTLCVGVCPQGCLSMDSQINILGYHFAVSNSEKCTGCGICYYTCPEPGAVCVYRTIPAAATNEEKETR